MAGVRQRRPRIFFLAHGGVRGCCAFCWAPLVCSGFLLDWLDATAFLCLPLWLHHYLLVSLCFGCATLMVSPSFGGRGTRAQLQHDLGDSCRNLTHPCDGRALWGCLWAPQPRVLGTGGWCWGQQDRAGGRGLHAMERPRDTAGALSPSVPHPAWAGTLLWVRAAPVLMPPDPLGCSGPTGRQQEASDNAAASCQGSKTLL